MEVTCAECGASMVLRHSHHGWFYGCKNYPLCKATHGAHQKTKEPFGIPGDAATRASRQDAHAAFDTLWKGTHRQMSRRGAYQWMMLRMNLPVEEAHIGRFTQKQCAELMFHVEAMKPENRGVGAFSGTLRANDE